MTRKGSLMREGGDALEGSGAMGWEDGGGEGGVSDGNFEKEKRKKEGRKRGTAERRGEMLGLGLA